MARARRQKVIRYIVHFILILFAYILQGMVFARFTLWGAKPLVLPVVVVCIAMNCGYLEGGICGLFAGVLCDVSLNQPAIVFTLLLTVAGLAIGWMFDKLLSRSIFACFVAAFALLLVCAFAQMFSLLIFDKVSVGALLMTLLGQTGYSLFFVIPVFYIARRIARIA